MGLGAVLKANNVPSTSGIKEAQTMIPSIGFDQHEILRWINKLHLDEKWIACDPCYGNGNFYTPDDIPRPMYVYDVQPKKTGEGERPILRSDCRDLPLADVSVDSLIFDPPFLQTTGEGSIIKDRFGSYPTMPALWEFYSESIGEFNRVLVQSGVLVVKMQNTVMSGKQWWSVSEIERYADENSFAKIDEFVLLAKHRMPQHNLKTQRHARKYHSYFLVFRKIIRKRGRFDV